MKDWLCKPTSLEEAKEIIERAVANGAENHNKYSGNCYNELFYGVSCGGITCEIIPVFYNSAEILTIAQVREQFPLPNEKSVKWGDLEPNSTDWLEFAKNIGATHWHEVEMKFAKAGDGWGASVFDDNGWEINDDYVCPSRYPKHWKQYLIDYSPLESKTERSERELWIEGAIKAMKEVHLTWDNKDPASEQKCRLYAEAIYDKLVKQK